MPSVTIEARSQVSNVSAGQRDRSASNADGADFAAIVDSNTSAASDRDRTQPAPPPAPSARPNSSDNPNGDLPASSAPTDKPASKPTASDTQTIKDEAGNGAKADGDAAETSDVTAATDASLTVDLSTSNAVVAPPAPTPAATSANPDSASDAPASIAATAIARVAAETGTAAQATTASNGENADIATTAATADTPAPTETGTETAASLQTRSNLLAAAASVLKANGNSGNVTSPSETDSAQDVVIPPIANKQTDVIKPTLANRKAEPKAGDAAVDQPAADTSQDGARPAITGTQGAHAHQSAGLAAHLQDQAATGATQGQAGPSLQHEPSANTAAQGQSNLDFASQLQLGVTTPATAPVPHAANAAQLATTAATTPQVPVQSIAVEIAANVQIGRSRFEIRLDPPELGRIDVRLDVDRQGNVTSHLLVEKASTLDFLRRDAQQLERALQDAGLKTSDNSLQFSLRDQQQSDRQGERERPGHKLIVTDEETVVAEAAGRSYSRAIGLRGGLDIRV